MVEKVPAPQVQRKAVAFPQCQDAAAELFEMLAEPRTGSPAAFLDSSDHGSSGQLGGPAPQRRRYSILAFSQGPHTEAVHLGEGAFGWLQRHWPHRGTPTGGAGETSTAQGPPFQLGWVGWIGYEEQAQLFRATHAVVVDHHHASAQIQTLGQDSIWVGEVETAIAQLFSGAQQGDKQVMPEGADSVWLEKLKVRDQEAEYLQKIRAAQAQIREGNSYEICLTTAVEGTFHGSPLSAYRRLREANRAPFTQYFNFPATEDSAATVLLSTSPERFVSIDAEGMIRSEPIKGTRPRGKTPQEDAAQIRDLETHPKDRAENVMIADLVRNDLSIHAETGSLRTERLCAVETYPSVHQMVSTVSARLSAEASRARALSDAFPPGSMTGAPKISTMNILSELETGPRGPYSGVAGYFSTTGACDLSVLIRTAALTSPGGGGEWDFHLGLGGAITADSDPAAEWAEVITKSRGVLSALDTRFPGG
ncbi:anthranilate synthase component I family protein [Nesterenkonia sedimenti]|nr:chorismate-binding protein [Nesterenkonia sedimenti]